ncbi:MAG: choice-of-anchor D domain-containing protein [Actinomycetota bacterium]
MKRLSVATSLAATFLLITPVPAFASSAVSVSPSELAFGSQCVAAQSNAKSLTISNTGADPLTVSSIAIVGSDPGDFSMSGWQGQTTVAPGQSFSVSVTFTAQQMGQRNAKLEITSNAPSSPDDVPLSGTGVTRVLDVTPDHLDFGNQRIQTKSDDLALSFTSTGTATVTVRTLHLTGNADDFIVGSSTPIALQPNQTASVPIAFKPHNPTTSSATLVIESDACAGKTSVALSGVGTTPKIQVSPSAVVFGLVSTGSTSEGLPMVVTNIGRAPLVISSIELQGAQSTDFRLDGLPDVPKVLGPGEEFPMSATFAPSQPGERTATLRITSDDPSNPSFTVSLSGNVASAGSIGPSTSSSGSDVASPTPSDSAAALAVGNRAKPSGAGDWFAIAIVCVIVGGVFTTLFAIRRRRELI